MLKGRDKISSKRCGMVATRMAGNGRAGGSTAWDTAPEHPLGAATMPGARGNISIAC